jgi:hypothetical protein
MSLPEDRVAAPSNGHEPALSPDDARATTAEATDLGSGRPSLVLPAIRPTVPSVTPTQAVVGFGIIAALILLLLGRRRGRSD